ncbi:SRPBCC family protein [Streptomyces hoynatensis]|uniref:RND transporter n=1 Tax=Streptomyces hoynatensis TaxID=1141874 RepID=A0A3A9YX51_9ACTN|nr:SRPBCC family protein [Streptomyces hoynatensis]RKN40379.1 RND transporter [Streptomyces hoynatensis]
MIEATHEFRLPVSPEEAFRWLSDPARDPEWQSACQETRLLNGPARPGCHYEIVFQMVGRRLAFSVEITDFEPGRHSRFAVLDGPFRYVGSYRYAEQEPGTTQVRWTFDVDPGDYFGIMPKSLLKKVLVTQVKKDSRALAERLAQASPTQP